MTSNFIVVACWNHGGIPGAVLRARELRQQSQEKIYIAQNISAERLDSQLLCALASEGIDALPVSGRLAGLPDDDEHLHAMISEMLKFREDLDHQMQNTKPPEVDPIAAQRVEEYYKKMCQEECNLSPEEQESRRIARKAFLDDFYGNEGGSS